MFELKHFLNGKLGREEVSSAFLAMVIEGSPIFRKFFFSHILQNEAHRLSRKKWDVQVEKDNIDIYMESKDTIVLIENKLTSASKQKGQLNRYYSKIRKQSSNKRIIAVYLAPNRTGMDEVKSVKIKLENDVAKHVSWEKILKYKVNARNSYGNMVKKGLEEISIVIDNLKKETYPPIGDRGIIRDIANEVQRDLSSKTNFKVSRWSSRESELVEIFTNITMAIAIVFKAQAKEPYDVINTRDKNGNLELVISTKFKIAAKAKKIPELKNWWQKLESQNKYNIPKVGNHKLEGRWFIYSKKISGDEKAVKMAMNKISISMIKALENKF